MNELMYSFRNNNVRVFMKDNEPWFVAKDVCDILDLNDVSKATVRLDEDEKGTITIPTLGGMQKVIAINEYGLYSMVLTSRKQEAKDFKRWITREVIPSIRKNGVYATESFIDKALSDPLSMIKVLEQLQKERNEKLLIESELQAAQPKIFFAEAVGESDSTISINQLAKLISQNGYKIGEIRLFEWLRNNKYLIREHGMDYNTPRQSYINQGLFVIKESVHVGSKGSKISKTTRVTGKGQQYFINKFLNYDKLIKDMI